MTPRLIFHRYKTIPFLPVYNIHFRRTLVSLILNFIGSVHLTFTYALSMVSIVPTASLVDIHISTSKS